MRHATWRKIGTDISMAKDVKEALALSGLDYLVEKREILLPSGTIIPNQFATAKAGTDTVFGIVGKDYEIVQNAEAFDFVNEIIPEGLSFVKAGETNYMNYIIAKLPENYILDDKFVPYIIFQNSHSGYTTVKAAICPLRIVCQNQFTMAFKEADNKISLRHSSSVHNKICEAKEILSASAEYMNTFANNAEKMAAIKVDKVNEDRIIEEYFRIEEDASTRKINSIEENRALFKAALNSEDNQNFRGTAWGMMNAFTDFLTHVEPKRNTEKSDMSKFLSVTFDTKNIEKFNQVVKRFAA